MDLLTKMDGSEREVTISVAFGEDASGAVKLPALRDALTARGVGTEIVDDVIAGHAVANLKVYFRSGAKGAMKGTKDKPTWTDAEIQDKINKMIPGIPMEKAPAQLPLAKLLLSTGKFTKDQVDAIMADPERRQKAEDWLAKLTMPKL